MLFFWTDEADSQYLKHYTDSPSRECFDELLNYIEDDPSRGIEVSVVARSGDPWEKRAATALRRAGFIPDARIVLAKIDRPAVRNQPWVLATVIHAPGAPPASGAHHTILTMGVILRTNKFD
jgi:hypothetical protein